MLEHTAALRLLRSPAVSAPSVSRIRSSWGEDGDIIAGHGRLAAARQLGLSAVPVIVLQGLSELQRRQLLLADNRIALNAGWDLEMLQLESKICER
jgi:ParB-like chromosome segregation protein Spo0J